MDYSVEPFYDGKSEDNISPFYRQDYYYTPNKEISGEHTLTIMVSDGYSEINKVILFKLPDLPKLPEEGISVTYRGDDDQIHFFINPKNVQKPL